MSEKICWNTLQDSLTNFHERITLLTNELHIADTAEKLIIDHAGIRIAEKADVDSFREELAQYAHCFSSEIVNGREIMLFQLHEPLRFCVWEIPCIELPYPKVHHEYKDGWEHIEFVVPSEATTLEHMRQDFNAQFPICDIEEIKVRYAYSEDVPAAESDQLPNPSIAIRKDKNTCIKFHPKSIQEVVGFVQ